MGTAIPILRSLRGMQTDPPLDQMPQGFVRKALDWNPRPNFAMAESRGIWTWFTGAISGPNGWLWTTYCPFVSGAKIVLSLNSTDTKYVTTLDGVTTGTAVPGGALASSVASPPIFHLTPAGGLLIYPGAGTSGIPRKYDGTANHANLGGSPPAARIAASWGDYLILANTSANPNRMFFSGVGNPESWPANNTVDFPEAIRAVVTKGNTIFVFGSQYVHLLVGDTPPPGGNLTLRKNLYPHGIHNGASGYGVEAATTYKDFVIWANKEGVFKSDGSQPIDLMKLGGLSSYWLYLLGPLVNPADKRLALGVYRNFLFVNVYSPVGVSVTCLIYDLEENAWWEWTNIGAASFTSIPKFTGTFGDPAPDLLWTDASSLALNQKIVGVRPCFTSLDTAGTAEDDNAAGPTPQLLTGAYRLGSYGKKRVKRGFLSYLQRVGASIELDVSWDTVPSPDADPTLIQLNTGDQTVFLANGFSRNVIRQAFRIDRVVEMVQILITSFGNNTGLRIFGIEVEMSNYDSTRAGDKGV